MGKERYIFSIDPRLSMFFSIMQLYNKPMVMCDIVNNIISLGLELYGDVNDTENSYNEIRKILKPYLVYDAIESFLDDVDGIASYYLNIIIINDLLNKELVTLDVTDNSIVLAIDHNHTFVKTLNKG